MPKTQTEKIAELILILELKKKRDGFYHTAWGKKSYIGLIETIKAILE